MIINKISYYLKKLFKENIKFFIRNGRYLKYREIISMNYTLNYRILLD